METGSNSSYNSLFTRTSDISENYLTKINSVPNHTFTGNTASDDIGQSSTERNSIDILMTFIHRRINDVPTNPSRENKQKLYHIVSTVLQQINPLTDTS